MCQVRLKIFFTSLQSSSQNNIKHFYTLDLWRDNRLHFCYISNAESTENSSIWISLRSPGHIILIRHAIAPGIGDPLKFTINDCSTQRDLSTGEQKQAKRIGMRLKENSLIEALTFFSQLCHCLETSKLLALGYVNKLPILNSFFQVSDKRHPKTQS